MTVRELLDLIQGYIGNGLDLDSEVAVELFRGGDDAAEEFPASSAAMSAQKTLIIYAPTDDTATQLEPHP